MTTDTFLAISCKNIGSGALKNSKEWTLGQYHNNKNHEPNSKKTTRV